MRVLYDGQMFGMQRAGGINRYFSSLISGLPITVTPMISLSQNRSIFLPKHINLRLQTFPFSERRPTRLWNFVEPLYISALEQLSKPSVFHPTFYKGLSRRKHLKLKCPMVVTVWDLLHKIFPKQLDPHGDWGEQIRRTIESADALICISNNTKRDLLHYYSVNEEKVKVIPLATNFDLPDKKGIEGTRSVSSTNRYFAFVGGRYGYKNFLLTLEAFAKLCESLSDLKLVVAGSAFTKQEQEDVARLRISEKIEHFLFPDDLTLRDIYQNSIALLYPSAYEGFGLPPLEALQSQTTVIAANASSLPEVIGDAGILLDRMDRDSLVDAMHYLANDDRARKNLIAKASSQSKQFSWEATTEKTVALYRSLAN